MKKFIASAVAALLLAGGAVVAIATPASAHTGDLSVSYSCDTTTGEYVGTAKLTISQTSLKGESKWRVGTTHFDGTPKNADGMDRGPVASTGAGTITLGTFRIPGTTTGKGPWVYAFTSWSDDFKKGSDGQSYDTLKGDCLPPLPNQPDDKVEYGSGVDGIWGCGDTTVTQTRTKSVTTYALVGREWVAQAPVVTSETQTRTLTADELKVAQSTNPAGECFVPPTNACTAENAGPTSTNLVPLWTNVDTRSAGHYEYVENGLHIWTDDASSNAKVSLGYAASFPLKNTGVLDLDWTGSTPPPGINLFVNFGADGTGTLVYESVYGQDLWLTNGSSAAVKANAPVNGGGNGSQWHGTIDQWLAKYPTAQVTGIAFSLGSGVKGDGVINSITAGCTVYHFDYERPAPPATPEPTTKTTYGEWTGGEPTCENKIVEQTRTVTTTTTTYGWEFEDGEWVKVSASSSVIGEPQKRTVLYEGEACPTPTPTPTAPQPSATPSATPAPTGGLAVTGGEAFGIAVMGTIGALLLTVGTALAIRRRRA